MGTEQRIDDDYIAALRAGQTQRKDTLRLMRSALKSATIAKRAPLTEEEVINVLSQQAKQRRDSIEEFQKGGRQDLVAIEEAELAVIQEYLPQQMSREEVEAIAREVVAELGSPGPAQLGQVMSRLMPRIKGRADGKMANEIVRQLLVQE